MKKNTIIFDCFGVLCSKVLEVWLAENFTDAEEANSFFDSYTHALDTGKMSVLELEDVLSKRVGRTPEAIIRELEDLFDFDMELVEYIRNLKNKGYKIGLLTNSNREFFARRIFPENPWFLELFDSVVISSDIGIVKPDPKIFEHALGALSANANEVIFVDDRISNTSAAEALGITSILYTSFPQMREELENLLK